MIDLKAIRTKFKLLAQQQVGSYLAQIGAGNDIPAVVDARPTILNGVAQPMPPYPYITVDVVTINDNYNYDSNVFIDSNTDTEIHQMYKTVIVMYRMYGGISSSDNDDHCYFVMNEFQNKFRLPLIIGDLENTLGLTPQLTTDLDTIPIQKATYSIDTAAFNVRCEIVDSVEDPDTFIIETVDLDGNVVLQDETTLNMSVTVTTP